MAKSLKQKILDKRGVVLLPHTRKPVTPDQLPTPFHKTTRMLLIELRFLKPIQELLATGTIDEVAAHIGVERSTVSYWRKTIREGG